MGRRYVNQLGPQEKVNEIFRVVRKQMRTNRNGTLYLQVDLTDRTGTITALRWNVTPEDAQAFQPGDYVWVEGTTQVYHGGLQLIAKRFSRVPPDQIDEREFVRLTAADLQRLLNRLLELVRSWTDPALRSLAECFLADQAFMERFRQAPAGVKYHHAYPGGLLEHTVQVMESAAAVANCYPQIDRNLLVAGAFFHDLGKVEELATEGQVGYTDEGQLVGHLVLGIRLLEQKLPEAEQLLGEPFPQETLLRLKHMIVSHHGHYEFGSPKLPMTLEALALYCLDYLDAQVFFFQQHLAEDRTPDPRWTGYFTQIGRKLFKGLSGQTADDLSPSLEE
ncbi:MAG: HD domain-containing protein [Thermoguttaceae bacterium]|nr:HD domain-containing protein [Thermoguttaceae bacterium]MDW8037969.1 HD domain-containing protein [Thermoguttaceae bacterium]